MKKHEYFKYLLLCFFFLINYNGYGQLNKFLIGTYLTDFTEKNSTYPPILFRDENENRIFYQRMLNYGINTIAGGDIINNDSFIYNYALKLGMQVITANRHLFNMQHSNFKNVIGMNLGDEFSFVEDQARWEITRRNQMRRDINDLIELNPHYLRWSNLLPAHADEFGKGESDQIYREGYLQGYIDTYKPNILSFDDYPVWYRGQTHTFFRELYDFGYKSTENSIPFFYVLTPFKNGEKTGWNDPEPESFPEFRYCIYSSLAYGAKGIDYWPGFEWVYNDGKLIQSQSYKINWSENTTTLTELIGLHEVLNQNSSLLLSLNFASAYHKSKESYTNLGGEEPIQYFGNWDGKAGDGSIPPNLPGNGIANDEYAKFVFGSNAVTPIVTSKTDYFISFMTDKEHNIYFWVVKKNHHINLDIDYFGLNLNENNVSAVEKIMTTPKIQYLPNEIKTENIEIRGGEGVLFKVIKKNATARINIDLTNKTYKANLIKSGDFDVAPFVTADEIKMNGTIFEKETLSSFMAHSIILGNGVQIRNGSTVRIKKYTDSNTTFSEAPALVKYFNSKDQIPENRNDKLETELKLYLPNQNKNCIENRT